MMRFIFIIVAVLLIFVGVIGGMYFWGIDPLAKLGLGTPVSSTEPEAPPPPAPSAYVEYGLMTIPVLHGRDVRKQAEMIIHLEVPVDKREIVANNLPRLQNAYLEDMITYLSVNTGPDRPLDVAAIEKRLLMIGERTLGPGFLRKVTIENPSLK